MGAILTGRQATHDRARWRVAALCVLALPRKDGRVWSPPIPWRSLARKHVQAWLNMRPERREPWANS